MASGKHNIDYWRKVARSRQKRLNEIANVIRAVENRCMAMLVLKATTDEMTERELQAIYRLASESDDG